MRTKQDIVAVAAGYLLHNKSIYLLYRIQSAEQQESNIIATLLVAMAAKPIEDPSLLPSLNADIYFFDVVLREEDGNWKLFSASWRQAMVDDFL